MRDRRQDDRLQTPSAVQAKARATTVVVSRGHPSGHRAFIKRAEGPGKVRVLANLTRIVTLLLAASAGMGESLAATTDLPTDASRLAAAWTALGGDSRHVQRLGPLFLERGRFRTLRLPASAYRSAVPGCTSLGFLAGRSVDFTVHIDPVVVPKHRPTGGATVRSVAGAALLVRCGADRQALERLAIELRASRGVIEVVMAQGPTPASEVSSALPERATGPLAPPFDPGPRLPLEPIERRLERAEARANEAGAARLERKEIPTVSEGIGSESIDLAEGCHRLTVMAKAAPDTWVDIDAELRDGATGRVLSRDRSDGADAQLETCVGAPSRALLVYAGAPEGAPLILSDATFAIPPGVPTTWGQRARGGLSSALFRHKLAPVSTAPSDVRLGASGVTPVRMLVEPGGCYVSVLTALAGDPRLVGLTASVDTRQAYDAVVQGHDGAAVAFCVEQLDRVDLQVEMRGGGAATWLLASWKMADVRLGEKR